MKKFVNLERVDKRVTKRVEDLTNEGVIELLEHWEMADFVDFVKEKEMDGRKLANVTEGIVKLWRPKSNANRLVIFVQELKNNPEKYLDYSKKDPDKISDGNDKMLNETIKDDKTDSDFIIINEVSVENDVISTQKIITTEKDENQIKTIQIQEESKMIENIESQYQTVKKTKDSSLIAFNNVEELIKKIVPPKSFLYRNQIKKETSPSYLPMDAGSPKKRNKFRISGYDYPIFDLRRYSRQDTGDRGYYPMKRNSKFFIQKSKVPDTRPKYKSLSSTEELKYTEDHFYEDLCYNEVETDVRHSVPNQNAKPYRVKIQELFQSFKIPFFKKNEEVIQEDKTPPVEEKEGNFYENTDSIANMYDSVHVNTQPVEIKQSNEKSKLPVEDYLEPVKLNKDYCDVSYTKPKDDSLLGYILSIFENRFGYKRESRAWQYKMCWYMKVSVPLMYNLARRLGGRVLDFYYRTLHCLTDVVAETNDAQSEASDDDKTGAEEKWSDEHKPKTSMMDRPLPVPVENEPYYMDIERTEAENLLKGQPDGTFVLRPSSQSSHAYTISVSCCNTVHNVGVRRRPDGRLALGFARRGERSFADVTSLLRHHKKRRLLLVANGNVIGATTLNDTPQYYQTPCNIPVKIV